jgi:pSer/pThr/pTyr-binding forkhead associated (FHA) protein/CDP-diglyceride synthetase
MEWTPLMPESHVFGVEVTIPYRYLFIIGLVSGLLIGLALGIAEALGRLSPREARQGVIVGALLGAGGGVIGVTFGNAFYNAMRALAGGSPYGPQLPGNLPPEARISVVPSPLAFLLMLIGRGLGWALIGAFIGLSQGIAAASLRRTINGAVGGFVGGGLGGSVFEILVWLNKGGFANFPPEMIRFISFCCTGGAIGLFIGFAGELAKKAWLVRLVGLNEGKQYVIEKPETVLGRSELVDVPIFGDPDVAERHALIFRQGERFYVEDLGSYSGTRVNDDLISDKVMLKDRDVITVGKTRLLFREKTAEGVNFRATGSPISADKKIPTSPYVCPFCGSLKDAMGNCQCTVSTLPSNVPTQVAQSKGQMTVPVDTQVQESSQLTQPLDLGVAPTLQTEQPRLIGIAGTYAGQVFTLRQDQTEIGRESTRDIVLSTDTAVSRRHARIVREGNLFVIYDEGSTNGTYVNNARVTRKELAKGDIIQIGSTKFRFEA